MSPASHRNISQNARLLSFENLEERRVLAADIQLVSDINTTLLKQGSLPQRFISAGNSTYFSVTSPTEQKELWITDGTQAGTVKVIDLPIQGPNQRFGILAEEQVNGKLIFTTIGTNDNTLELWSSDGTSAGTKKISEFVNHFYHSILVNINNTVYSVLDDRTHGIELWKTDGTVAGTQMVVDLQPGVSDGLNYNTQITNLNGTLFFSTSDGIHGKELWKSDGTAAGTELVKDISPKINQGSNPSDFLNVNGTLYFTATDGTHGRELWRSDGTTGGTKMVKDITPSNLDEVVEFGPHDSFTINDTLYFQLFDSTSSSLNLWKSDGSANGTVKVTTIEASSINYRGFKFTEVNGEVFYEKLSSTLQHELWKSDGTAAGTVLVKVTGTRANAGYYPSYPTNVNGTLYFVGKNEDASQSRLWKSDGTAEGTTIVTDVAVNEFGFGKGTGGTTSLFLSANDQIHGYQPWISDGTSNGTVVLKNIYTATDSSNPLWLVHSNDTTYFTGATKLATNNETSNGGLWKSDGTPGGTSFINSFGGDIVQGMTLLNGTLFYVTTNQIDCQLWKSDGTPSGTVLVKEFKTPVADGTSTYEIQNLTVVNNLLYFGVRYQNGVPQLWKSDGTTAGTVSLNVKYGFSSSSFANVNGTLYFQGFRDANFGYELWKTNGTVAGTVQVKDIAANPMRASSSPYLLTNVNGTLFFTATTALGRELWKSDGTDAGTQLVKDINSGAGDGIDLLNDNMFNVGGTLMFSAKTSSGGRELWKSDGTEAGTIRVKQVLPDFGTFGDGPAANLNGTLFFVGTEPGAESGLWKTDGTEAGTTFVKNIVPNLMTAANDELYLTVLDTSGFNRLWKSDGTSLGTVPVVDSIDPDKLDVALSINHHPRLNDSLSNLGGTLYIRANSDRYGVELFRLQNLSTSITTNPAGNIEINDVDGKKNQLVISRAGTNLVVQEKSTDTSLLFTVSGVAGATGNNSRTVSIPLATILATGKPLLINTGAGNDTVSIDLKKSYANSPIPSSGISIDLGTGEDSFNLLNDPTNNVWTLDGAQSGAVKVGALGTVTLQGVENVAGGTGVDVFKLTNAAANGILSIKGNAGTDAVEVTRDADFMLSNFKLTVTSGAVNQTFALSSIEQASLTGGEGNNFINAKAFTGTTKLNGRDGNDILWGGSGNDFLNGGNGNDWLSGGAGRDTLLGYNGRDILVGGLGVDKLNDSAIPGSSMGDDLLIGGTTSYDNDKTAIDLLLASWVNPYTYSGHIAKLTSGVGPQNKYKLNSTTVLDDNASDSLIGGGGLDWFFATTSGANKDTHDRAGNEQ